MNKYHANELLHAINHAQNMGQDFVTIGAAGMKHINIDIPTINTLARQAEGWTKQAMRTRFHGPTNYKGSRISAAYAGGKIYVGYDHALNQEGNHRAAAQVLADKLGWGPVVDGGGFDNDYYWLVS